MSRSRNTQGKYSANARSRFRILLRRRTIAIACLLLAVCFLLAADYYKSAAILKTSKEVVTQVDGESDAVNSSTPDKTLVYTKTRKRASLVPFAGGDTCGSATVIDELPFNDSGTTVGMADDYDLPTAFTAPTVTGCPSCNATGGGPPEAAPRGGVYLGTGTGPDVAYSISFTSSNNSIDVTLTPTASQDVALIVYTDVCSSSLSDAIVVDDDGADGEAEHVVISNMPAGTYNIVVDAYSTGGASPGPSGPYTIDVTGGAPSPTNTATPSSNVISGTVTYGNAIGSPNPRFVSNATVTGAGSPTVMTTTAAPGATAGQYSLAGLGGGSYTVAPSKTGGVNNLTSFDAAKIAQHVAGISLLTGNQLIVADVSNNGNVSSFDAAEIANFVVSAAPSGISGTWKFVPVNRTYSSVSGSITGQDFAALLMGEVSGNWTNTGARPASELGKAVSVKIPQLAAPAGDELVVPISVHGAANKGIISYEFDLRYDPAVVQPLPVSVDLTGTVSRGLTAVANAKEPGLLKVVLYGPMPIDADGVLLNLRFAAVGKPGSTSTLAWERIMFNEGDLQIITNPGLIRISSAPRSRVVK